MKPPAIAWKPNHIAYINLARGGRGSKLNSLDQKLLARLQNGFPLTSEPFADLGKALSLSGDSIIQRIRQFKDDGVIRQISPVFDARSLGYATTLAAMRVPEDRLERCSRILLENDYISHAYERDHPVNIWFTLAMTGPASIEREIKRIADTIPVETVFQLPSLKLYKIGAFFGTDNTCKAATGELTQAVELSPEDRKIINELQQDIPLISRPFVTMSTNTGMDEQQFLNGLRSLLERGLMRRYGAAVNHRKIGYNANAMVCWNVLPESTDKIGRHLASLRQVSHCYERKTNTEWPYNIFAMIHGKARETCLEIVDEVSKDFGLGDFLVLFSTRELKKARIKYPV